MVQEGLHSIKTRNTRVLVVKVDLYKAYDRVRWFYSRLMLIHFGFCFPFVN
jgi:hypothetical protein